MNSKDKTTIEIIGEENEFLYITDGKDQYVSKIHKSLIPDNELKIEKRKIIISNSLYIAWFKSEIQKNIQGIIQKREGLILDNIALLLAHKDKIINEPGFHNILASGLFYGHQFGVPKNSLITIGELLEIWSKEPYFSSQCKCEGNSYVYHFGGSVLSGAVIWRTKCVRCGKLITGRSGRFRTMMEIRRAYNPLPEPILYDLDAFEQLIDVLKSKSGA
jgi:hypothetical protein